MDMATASAAASPNRNVLLRLLSLSPSSNTAIIADQMQRQKGGKLQFLSLSLSPASKVIVKSKTKRARLDDGAFQCRTCGRRFATFQALGGHRTSHKRPRVRAAGLDLLLGARRPGKAKRNVHRCRTCGTVFPTGQALGGHMRRHRAIAETETTTLALSEEADGEDDEGRLRSTLVLFI